MNASCERHRKIDARGLCPICMLNERDDALIKLTAMEAVAEQWRADFAVKLNENERLRAENGQLLDEMNEHIVKVLRVGELQTIIADLLNHLPDSGYEGKGDESWDWCWNELSSHAQDEVKAARDRAQAASNR